ncbi:sigma-70 family RNA polymerase sigma factor [Streptomyces sp. NPDC049881]|uniref:sigma-70 family RNA polymerase sigma factor n=1 Tax=Streptomyces sp. NPDC049881 TaxID=3155778 RepID=UPI003414501B
MPTHPSSPTVRGGPADETVTAWALAARDGDPDATERFVTALYGDVLRLVAHLSADPQSADDLAQDTFARALVSIAGFQGRSAARTWLFTIARRVVVDSFRHRAARPRRAAGEDWLTAAESAQPRNLPGHDDRVVLGTLLDSLPQEQRRAFVLTQLAGVPYADAARLCDCPVGTVRSRVARARAALGCLLHDADLAARDRLEPAA